MNCVKIVTCCMYRILHLAAGAPECCTVCVVDCVWNVMAHAQRPDFVFRRNGRVHLNWWGRQFSRLLPAEICASAGVESSWNVMAHGDAREGKWRGNWRMEWVASTLHTTSEHGVSSITTADAHTSAASNRLNWPSPPGRFKWTRTVSPKDEIWFLRVCHHISNAL